MLTLWRKWIAYPMGWVVLMGIVLTILGIVALARPTFADMESFDARYEASLEDRQVRLEVEERIAVILDGDRGIVRDLVTRYGENNLDITGISVSDARGNPVEFDENRDPATGDIELAIGGDARLYEEATYVIRYTIGNAMVGTSEYQELYFNTNGTEWQNGFKEFSAKLVLDDALAAHLSGATDCYQGRAGSQERCTVRRGGGVFSVDLPAGLRPWENVTVAVGFQPGTVSSPLAPFEARSLGWLGIGIILGIGLLALGVSQLARVRVRDLKRTEPGLVTQFTPPEDIEPILVADFLGRPEKGAAAHLTWLVLQGLGEITTVDGKHTAIPAPGSDNLSSGEQAKLEEDLRFRWHIEGLPSRLRTITELMFGDAGEYQRLSRYRGSSNLFKAQDYRDRALLDMRLRKGSNLASWMLSLGYLGLVGFGSYQIWLGLAGLGSYFMLAGTVSTILLLWAVHRTPAHGRLTKRGHDLRRHLMGLERFITASEANRIAWLQNAATAPREDERVHLYERLLPYAIIFGAERSWSQLTGDMYDRFPELRIPRMGVIVLAANAWAADDEALYRRRETRSRRSSLHSRADIGQGSLARGWKSTVGVVSDYAAGRYSTNSSTRSSGRGWGGGSSSSRSRGGSRGGGRSGGGTGGGGGGRR